MTSDAVRFGQVYRNKRDGEVVMVLHRTSVADYRVLILGPRLLVIVTWLFASDWELLEDVEEDGPAFGD